MDRHTNPLVQLCRDSIAAHRTTLDNLETLVNSWPEGTARSSGAGGARGFRVSTSKRPSSSKSRSRGARGRSQPQTAGATTR